MTNSGSVIVFTGDGWGKSAAAVGYTVRARYLGWPVSFIQFLKGGAWNSPEVRAGRAMGINWPILTPGLTWGSEDPRDLAKIALSHAEQALNEDGPSLTVLDELTRAIHNGWVSSEEVVQLLERRSEGSSVIITGRLAVPELDSLADTITDFRLEKDIDKRGILKP